MKFNIEQLKRKGIERQEIDCSFAPDSAVTGSLGAAFEGEASVRGTLTIVRGGVFVDVTVKATVAGECARCLGPASAEVIGRIAEEFPERGGEPGYSVVRGEIDLRRAAEEALMLEMPARLLCREDCRGICPGCGADLNREPCSCKKDEK